MPDALGMSQGFQLFHPHPDGADPRILETGRGDALGQGFGQPDMAFGDDGADALFDHVIVHDIFQHVLGVGDVVGGQVDIDAHRLGAAFFLAVDADMGRQFQVADEDMADAARGAGEIGLRLLIRPP